MGVPFLRFFPDLVRESFFRQGRSGFRLRRVVRAVRPTYNRRAGVEQIPSRMRFLRGQVAHGKGPGRMRLPLMIERLRNKYELLCFSERLTSTGCSLQPTRLP